MVRGTWLSRSGGFPTYGLPQPLLSHLRAALGCDFDESTTETDVRTLCFHDWCVMEVMWYIYSCKPYLSLYFQIKENDRVVLETLLSIFNPMLEELPEPDDSDWCYTQTLFCVGAIHQHHLPVHLISCRESASWDVKLALDYKDLQRRIISSIVTSCMSALENV